MTRMHSLRSVCTGAILLVLLGACAPLSGEHSQDQTPPPQGFRSGEPPLVAMAAMAPAAEAVSLRVDAPKTYVVKPGDTLWDLASRFLKDPWRWREIWRQNPDIENPDLIYPGDVIEVFYEGEQPRLQIATDQSGGGSRPTIKLSPRIRVEPLAQPITTIPREAVEPYLTGNRIMTKAEWQLAPYVVGTVENSLLMSAGDRIFARGAVFDLPRYTLFRPGEEYHDPVTGKSLGFEVARVAEARLEEDGDPAILRLTSSIHGVKPGDRLFAEADLEEDVLDLMPRPALSDTEGEIIGVLGTTFLIGRNQTVVLNLGELDDVEPGYVLEIYKPGRKVKDPLTHEKITLPDDRSGLVMVYRVFDRASYALVTEATREIRPHYRVRTPGSRDLAL